MVPLLGVSVFIGTYVPVVRVWREGMDREGEGVKEGKGMGRRWKGMGQVVWAVCGRRINGVL